MRPRKVKLTFCKHTFYECAERSMWKDRCLELVSCHCVCWLCTFCVTFLRVIHLLVHVLFLCLLLLHCTIQMSNSVIFLKYKIVVLMQPHIIVTHFSSVKIIFWLENYCFSLCLKNTRRKKPKYVPLGLLFVFLKLRR